MSTITRYGPPGRLTDLSDVGLKAWHVFIADSVDQAINGPDPSQVLHDSPRSQFYNLTKTETAPDAAEATVTWTAFPNRLRSAVSDRQRWRRADASRDVQDEYCEWSVTRNEAGKIIRVAFTCEGPEYWDVLAQTSPETALELYRAHISPSVQSSDLFGPDGRYLRRNKWNDSTTHGAMHLIQPSNTLGAEIELAAAATIRRVIEGRQLTGAQELIACSKYGVADRNSDPHIGEVVNSVARQKADLALSDPVGLYFDDLATDGWSTPDGSDAKSYWTYERGDTGHPVRAVYEVAERNFTVGDITISGKPIEFGAQIADFITMKLTAVACRFGRSTTEPQTACAEPPAREFSPGAFSPTRFRHTGTWGSTPTWRPGAPGCRSRDRSPIQAPGQDGSDLKVRAAGPGPHESVGRPAPRGPPAGYSNTPLRVAPHLRSRACRQVGPTKKQEWWISHGSDRQRTRGTAEARRGRGPEIRQDQRGAARRRGATGRRVAVPGLTGGHRGPRHTAARPARGARRSGGGEHP